MFNNNNQQPTTQENKMKLSYTDCDICGERYHNEFIEMYTTETIFGTGNETEIITHCKSCIPKKKQETTESEIKDLFYRELEIFKTAFHTYQVFADKIQALDWKITLSIKANNKTYFINMWDYENIDLICMAIDKGQWNYI